MISSKWFTGNDDLSDPFYIRRKVFVEEQGVPAEIDFDGSDADARLVVIYERDSPVATGRIVVNNGAYTLGRIAVLKEKRGSHYGDLVVRMLIRKCFDLGVGEQFVHAQTKVQKFYEKLGFVAYGAEYLEAGISHISMVHKGDVTGNC